MLSMSSAKTRAFLMLAVGLVGACERSDDDSADDPLGDVDLELGEAAHRVLDAWREADLELSDARPLGAEADAAGTQLGGTCMAAKVADIPVVMCEHESADEARAAEERGLKLVGEATGFALANGELLLVAADRHEVDPEGRRLNEIANAFRRVE